MNARPLLTPDTHYSCHCPTCCWARVGAVRRAARWVWSWVWFVLKLTWWMCCAAGLAYTVLGAAAKLWLWLISNS